MHVPHAPTSLGASTAVLLAATSALGAVSGVVACQGWPGVEEDERAAARLVVPGQAVRSSGVVVLGSTSVRIPVRLADSVMPRRSTRRRPRPVAPSDFGAPAPSAFPPSGSGAI